MIPLEGDTQRLWDLVRYQRHELHQAGLITDDEFAELTEDIASIARLEYYCCKMIAEIQAGRARLA
jgi:hypothetical protein